MIQGVIFDFDGVVIESEAYFEDIEIRVFTKHGIPLTKEVFSQYLGFKLDEYISALEERYDTSVNHAQITEELHAEIKKLYENEVPVVEHVVRVLDSLQKTYKIALATSRERHLAGMAMGRLELAQYFKHAVYKEDVTKGKPHPEVYLKAASLIGLAPSSCIVIEDAKSGFESAKAAGMTVIARQAGHNKNQDFSLADFVVRDMREIPKIIKKL